MLPQYSFLLAAQTDVPQAYAAELDSMVLFEDRLVAMINSSHPLASKSSLTVQELVNETLFFPSPDLAMYERISRMFEENDQTMPYGNTFPYLIYRRMAQDGMGISFTTERIGSLEPPTTLRYLPIENTQPLSLRLYWRRQKPLTADEQAFRAFVERFYHPV